MCMLACSLTGQSEAHMETACKHINIYVCMCMSEHMYVLINMEGERGRESDEGELWSLNESTMCE